MGTGRAGHPWWPETTPRSPNQHRLAKPPPPPPHTHTPSPSEPPARGPRTHRMQQASNTMRERAQWKRGRRVGTRSPATPTQVTHHGPSACPEENSPSQDPPSCWGLSILQAAAPRPGGVFQGPVSQAGVHCDEKTLWTPGERGRGEDVGGHVRSTALWGWCEWVFYGTGVPLCRQSQAAVCCSPSRMFLLINTQLAHECMATEPCLAAGVAAGATVRRNRGPRCPPPPPLPPQHPDTASAEWPLSPTMRPAQPYCCVYCWELRMQPSFCTLTRLDWQCSAR
jgi:hypothetical protein